ncbi:hypothetical protein [Variovorax sp. SG517]|uniref:hypothetical protein n=1 Tax=Variovorax sp. SG517 TaxID=2587117 RepID=UPI00159D39F5|nr:hypothetical protein [Variovorax sp. SG517]
METISIMEIPSYFYGPGDHPPLDAQTGHGKACSPDGRGKLRIDHRQQCVQYFPGHQSNSFDRHHRSQKRPWDCFIEHVVTLVPALPHNAMHPNSKERTGSHMHATQPPGVVIRAIA